MFLPCLDDDFEPTSVGIMILPWIFSQLIDILHRATKDNLLASLHLKWRNTGDRSSRNLIHATEAIAKPLNARFGSGRVERPSAELPIGNME